MSPTLGGALTRPFGPSFQLQGATKTPLRGTKAQLVRLRTTGGLAAARTGDPQSIRGTRAPEALRPLRRIPKNRTGEGWSLAHANADADAGATTPSACNCNTSNAGAVPRHEASPCLRTAQAWRCARCVCGVVVVVRRRARVERASQRRLSDVAAQWQRRSTRALTMFSADNRRRRARGGEQGPAEVVYLCRLPIWGQPLARWRPCRPSVVPG